MGCLAYVFVPLVMFTGIPAMWQHGFWLGLCGTIAPFGSLVAGAVIAETFTARESVRWGSSAVAVVLAAGMAYWTWNAGWHVIVFGHDIPGLAEDAIGFVIGIIHGWAQGTRRKWRDQAGVLTS